MRRCECLVPVTFVKADEATEVTDKTRTFRPWEVKENGCNYSLWDGNCADRKTAHVRFDDTDPATSAVRLEGDG